MDLAQLQALTAALERMANQFKYERFTFLGVAVAAAAMTFYAIWSLIQAGTVTLQNVGTIGGATGVLTAASLRVAYFLNRTFDLIEIVVRGAYGQPAKPERDA